MSKMLRWIASKGKGVTRHHLEGIGATAVVSIGIFYVVEAYNKRKKEQEKEKERSRREEKGKDRDREKEEKKSEKSIPQYSRSQSLGALHGGRVAMQRILDAHRARVDPSVLDLAEQELTDLLKAEERLDFSKLQSVVAKLEMSGKEDAALKTLIAEKEKADKSGRCHEAYELDMLIVEMFIYKGDLEKADERACLKDDAISDARRPLYKSIIRFMRGEENWNEFKKIQSHCQSPDVSEQESTHSELVQLLEECLRQEPPSEFDKFKRAVGLLKAEIEAAKEKK